jgi:hypothetical protein
MVIKITLATESYTPALESFDNYFDGSADQIIQWVDHSKSFSRFLCNLTSTVTPISVENSSRAPTIQCAALA